MTKILSDNASLRWRREQGVRLSADTRLSTDTVILLLFYVCSTSFLVQSDRVHY